MADENKALVNGLPERSKIENTDRFLGSGTSEEFLVNLDNLANAVFEKIKSEFGAAAFLKVANNDTTTAEGYVADARAVNALGKEVDAVNSSFNFKNVQGQIGKSGSINCFANIYMRTFPGNMCDIHIQFRIDMTNPESENWVSFNMDAIKGLLGLKTLTIPRGIIRPVGHVIPQVPDIRCGYQINTLGEVGRYYRYAESGQEGWGSYNVKTLLEQEFFVLNHYYEIDIYGATYS